MKRFFFIAQDGLPIVAAVFAVGFLFIALGAIYLGVPFFLFAIMAAVFFRDPERKILKEPEMVLSPADGRVIELLDSADIPGLEAANGGFKKASIFMSVLNVHVNRMPWSGKVVKTEHAKGKFFHAGSEQAAFKNESNSVFVVDNEKGHSFLIRQIAGSLARRIVCRAKEGDELKKGERFGMIKFGSRVELYMPKSFEFTVKIGDKVKAGLTALGKTR